MNKSPLRYPGGKTRAIKILTKTLEEIYPGRTQIISPFFGGGSFELHMAKQGCHVEGNDLLQPLYTFWMTLKNKPYEVATKVQAEMPITKDKFHEFKASLNGKDPVEVATKLYVVNRSSFSGSTTCGGFSSNSAVHRLTESIRANLTKVDLTNIRFTNMDCNDFLDVHPETHGSVVFADPPYCIPTKLYEGHMEFDHEAFATKIRSRNDYLITYNDCEYIRNLYHDCTIVPVEWSYGMNKSKKSSEILIYPSFSNNRGSM